METQIPNATLSININRLPDDGLVHIEVRDNEAVVQFLDLAIPKADFVRCLGGFAHVECAVVVRDLDRVGKVREHCTVEAPLLSGEALYGDAKRDAAAEAIKLACPEGWTPSLHFNSQSSFFRSCGVDWCRTYAHRWVEREEG